MFYFCLQESVPIKSAPLQNRDAVSFEFRNEVGLRDFPGDIGFNKQTEMSQPIDTPQRHVPRYLTQILIVLVAYVIAGKLGQATTSIRSSNLGPVWPAYGVALAAVLLYGYRIWLGIAAAAFLVALWSPVGPGTALGQAVGTTLAALTGAFFLRRVVSFKLSMQRVRDALGLIILGALASTVVSASIGVAVLYASGVQAYAGLGSAWLVYWMGDATGALLVTPLIVTLPSFPRLRDRRRITELGLLLVLLAAVTFVVFADLPLIPVRLHVFAFCVLPFVMWAAIRFEVIGTSLSILLIATIATVETALGSGPFSSNTQFMNAVLLDVFFGVLAITGLTLASAVAERSEAERAREVLIREQALHQREEELLEAQRVAHVGSWLWNPETDTVSWSEELYRLFGRDPALPAPTYQEHPPLYTPESWEELQKVVEKGLRTGAPYELDLEIVRADGSTGWIRARGEALRDTTGRITQLRGTAQDITERRRAEQSLRESEEKFRSVFRNAGVGMVIVSLERRFLAANSTFCEYLGYTEEELQQKTVQSVTHSDDWPEFSRKLKEAVARGSKLHRFEKRCLHKTGRVVFTESSACVVRGVDGTPQYFVGEVVDITERKLAEEALSGVNRKLIEAQEQERIRVARELHDDIGQRLSLLTMAIDILRSKMPAPAGDAAVQIDELSKLSNEVTSDVHAISHRLHSSKLEYMGLVPAIRSFCREFAEQQKLKIEFAHDEFPHKLPQELSLCFYRILQEALHNAAKHSQARCFDVELRKSPIDIRLTVSDSGVGFDPKSASSMSGLGFVSMRERVKLVNGTIAIESKPMGGTIVRVHVPFRPEKAPQARGEQMQA